MTCPICDQKPINCDCTDRERRMYRELNDVQELLLTDEERAALTRAIETLEGVEYIEAFSTENDATAAAILRGLLARNDAT